MRLSRIALFVAVGAAVLAACSAPPATTGPVSSSSSGPISIPEGAGGYGPGDYCADTYVIIQETTRSNFSLGSEYYRNDDYCAAYPYMKWLLDNEPLFTGEDPDDRNYLRMARIYEAFAAQVDSTDMDTQKAYLDSALMMRREGVEAMDAAGVAYDSYLRDLQEGFFFFQNRGFYDDAEAQEFAAFRRAFEASPDSLEDWYLGELFNTSALAFEAEEGEANPERAEFVRQLAEYVDNPEAQEYYTNVADVFENPAAGGVSIGSDAAVEALVSGLRAGTISDDDALVLLAVVLQQPDRLESLGEDVAELRTAVLRLEAVTNRVDNPRTLAALAFQAYSEGDTARGNSLFQRAIENAESNLQRADFYYSRGQSGDINNALRAFPSHGPSLYARANAMARSVGSQSSLRGRFAYWCLADEFRNVAARTTDSRIAQTARTAAARYERAAPTREQYFLEGYQPGQTVTASLGAYGSCSTRVR